MAAASGKASQHHKQTASWRCRCGSPPAPARCERAAPPWLGTGRAAGLQWRRRCRAAAVGGAGGGPCKQALRRMAHAPTALTYNTAKRRHKRLPPRLSHFGLAAAARAPLLVLRRCAVVRSDSGVTPGRRWEAGGKSGAGRRRACWSGQECVCACAQSAFMKSTNQRRRLSCKKASGGSASRSRHLALPPLRLEFRPSLGDFYTWTCLCQPSAAGITRGKQTTNSQAHARLCNADSNSPLAHRPPAAIASMRQTAKGPISPCVPRRAEEMAVCVLRSLARRYASAHI